MVTLTMVGTDIAAVGTEFIAMGETEGCSNCKFRNVCITLEKGRKYRITAVRPVTHSCIAHEDEVRVVEVEQVPRRIALESGRFLMDGATITFPGSSCKKFSCKYYSLCNPAGIDAGMKIKAIKIVEKLECPERKNINMVEI